MASTSSLGGSAAPLSPLAARSALLFIDLGYVQPRGREIFGKDAEVDPLGVGRFIAAGSVSQGPFSSTMQRAYIYDAKPNTTNPKAPHSGPAADGEPSQLHRALEATDQVTMRYGRMLNGNQKGVDTRLVLDLTKYAWTGFCQVAHIMTNDTDFEPAIEAVAELGVQVVLYQFADSSQNLHDRLRSSADRVVTLDRPAAADLFSVPLYYVRRNYESAIREATEGWFTGIANEAGWAETYDQDLATVDVMFGTHTAQRRDRPWVIAANGTHRAVTCDRHGRSNTHSSLRNAAADEELRSFFDDIRESGNPQLEAD